MVAIWPDHSLVKIDVITGRLVKKPHAQPPGNIETEIVLAETKSRVLLEEPLIRGED